MNMTIVGINGGAICSERPGAFVCQFNINVNMTYRVQDEKLAKDLQASSGHIKMRLGMEQTSPSKDNQMDMNIKSKADLDLKVVDPNSKAYLISGAQEFKMQIASQSAGPESSPDMSAGVQMFGGMSEQLHYSAEATGVESDLNASIVFNGNSAPEEKYFVDDVFVSSEAYASERDKFSNSMMTFEVKVNP
ncbi:MAG: hypothetical protein JNM39_06270 [Bdellovibrionaceae bacterium]|nr:hypothetical protein [Pseudobdellovibrionaceae bacterium]